MTLKNPDLKKAVKMIRERIHSEGVGKARFTTEELAEWCGVDFQSLYETALDPLNHRLIVEDQITLSGFTRFDFDTLERNREALGYLTGNDNEMLALRPSTLDTDRALSLEIQALKYRLQAVSYWLLCLLQERNANIPEVREGKLTMTTNEDAAYFLRAPWEEMVEYEEQEFSETDQLPEGTQKSKTRAEMKNLLKIIRPQQDVKDKPK